jgi:hypothetical protein
MSYGVTSDYFGLGDTDWRPQSNQKAPTAAGEAQAEDSHGDVQASKVHGKAGAWTTTYKVVGGDTGLGIAAKIKLGQIVAIDSLTNAVITGFGLATNNRDYPVATVNGVEFFGDSLSQLQYTIPGVAAIKPLKRAQPIGMSVAGNNRLNSSELRTTLEVLQAPDSLGVFVQTDAYKGRAEATGEAVNASAAPVMAADTTTGWALQTAQGVNAGNTDYGKGTLAVYKNILPDS